MRRPDVLLGCAASPSYVKWPHHFSQTLTPSEARKSCWFSIQAILLACLLATHAQCTSVSYQLVLSSSLLSAERMESLSPPFLTDQVDTRSRSLLMPPLRQRNSRFHEGMLWCLLLPFLESILWAVIHRDPVGLCNLFSNFLSLLFGYFVFLSQLLGLDCLSYGNVLS